MSQEVLEALLNAAAELDADVVNIVWHGGEPLLAGIEFFKSAISKQRELCDLTGVHFVNSLQTNGTLITDDWAEFFAEQTFDVGVSLDVSLQPAHLPDQEQIKFWPEHAAATVHQSGCSAKSAASPGCRAATLPDQGR